MSAGTSANATRPGKEDPISTTQTDTDRRRQEAVDRLQKREDFYSHVAVYIVINALLVLVWFLTMPEGFFWPVIPAVVWGLGVIMHALDTYRRPISEERIRREMERRA